MGPAEHRNDGAAAQSFTALVRQHQSMVFSIAMRMLGDRGIAEEVAQDVFMELHRALPRLESAEHVLFWLRRTATHRATDALRRRKVRPEAGAEEWEPAHEAAGRAGQAGREAAVSVRLEKALLTLPPEQRAIVLLRYQEEMSPEEIARATGQTVGRVKSHLQRGMVMLRRRCDVLLKEFVRG